MQSNEVIVTSDIDIGARFREAIAAREIFFMLAWRLFYVSEDKVIEKMI
jgi:hypothetical protein